MISCRFPLLGRAIGFGALAECDPVDSPLGMEFV
jgi:hypothetical protein